MTTLNEVAPTVEEQILGAMEFANDQVGFDEPVAQDAKSLFAHNCNAMYAVDYILGRPAREVIQYQIHWGNVSLNVVSGELNIYSVDGLSYDQIIELEALAERYGLDYDRSFEYEVEEYVSAVEELAENMAEDADIQEHYGVVETPKVEEILARYSGNAYRAIRDMDYIKGCILDIEPAVEEEELAA